MTGKTCRAAGLLLAVLSISCALPALAHAAAPRRLTLAEAVGLAMRVDPVVAESHIAEDRSKLGVLRAQLDRVSLKVDGQIQELWEKSNIGGPTVYLCSIGTTTFAADPTTCVGMGGTSARAADQAPSGGQGLFNLSANLNVPLFSGFRVSSNVKRAQLQRDAAIVGVRQSRHDTALAVARAYWSVRRLSLLREVQQASIERMREAEQVTAARVQAGLAPPIDRNRATLRRLQQAATLEDLQGQVKEAAAQLAVSLGIPGELELVDPPSLPVGPPPPLTEVLAEAHGQRPELKSAELQLEAQHQTLRMARSNYYPQLGLFGLFQYGNNPFSVATGARGFTTDTNPFTQLSGDLTLGANLSMNFFDTFNTYTSSRDARYEESRLAEEKRRIGRVVDADVRVADAKVMHLYAQRQPLVQAVAVARDNLKILEARYKNGDALVIEFLDAQIDLGNAELQLVDVTAQLKLAWLELEAATGQVVGVAE